MRLINVTQTVPICVADSEHLVADADPRPDSGLDQAWGPLDRVEKYTCFGSRLPPLKVRMHCQVPTVPLP